MRKRTAQDYSAAEFDGVVKMIQDDAGLRADIEAITGQSLDGKTPRELFDAFRTIEKSNEVLAAVVNHGRARQAVRDTRAMLEADADASEALRLARNRIEELERKNEELKRKNATLNAVKGATPLQIASGGRA